MTVAPVLRATHVHQPIEHAFALFTEQIGAWWPLRTHGLFGERSAGVEFVDGHVVERSVTGETTVWADVTVWDPPNRLVVAWHPGGSPDQASTVEVRFFTDADGTRVELTHSGWERFGEDGLARRDVYVGPNTWGAVLDHYTDIGDKAVPRADLSTLRGAYDAFFAEATAGGFGPPPPGTWSAEEVVAHVAINDDLLGAVCRGLIHRSSTRYENADALDGALLTSTVAGRSLGQLIELGQRRSSQLLTLFARLDADQLSTEVPCVLRDGGQIVFDQLVPWGRLLLEIQPGMHLSGHTRQLTELRP